MPLANATRVAGILFVLSSAVLVLVPILFLWAGFTLLAEPALLQAAYPRVQIAAELSFSLRAFALALGLFPAAVAIWTLWHMRALFDCYRRADVFSHAAARRLRLIGLGALLIAATSIVVHTLQILVLTSANPPGHRAVSLELGTAEIGFLLTGGLLLVVGWVLQAAAELAQDHAKIV